MKNMIELEYCDEFFRYRVNMGGVFSEPAIVTMYIENERRITLCGLKVLSCCKTNADRFYPIKNGKIDDLDIFRKILSYLLKKMKYEISFFRNLLPCQIIIYSAEKLPSDEQKRIAKCFEQSGHPNIEFTVGNIENWKRHPYL